MIDNFSALTPEEQTKFAQELLAKVNAAQTFLSGNEMKLDELEANELDGSLDIFFSVEDFDVGREAEWQAADEDEAYRTPSRFDVDFIGREEDEVRAEFKATQVEFEGYQLEIANLQIDDYEISDAEVDSTTDEDAGIGHYDHFGYEGYDSRPYVQVEGTVYCSCSIGGCLNVVLA